MTRLALLALLLVALAPAVSRVLAAGSTQLLAGWSQLCTSAGLQLLPSPASSPSGKSSAPMGMPADADCAYCPLAASLPLLLLCLGFALVVHARWIPPSRPSPALHGAAHLRGLGCRGPPLAL